MIGEEPEIFTFSSAYLRQCNIDCQEKGACAARASVHQAHLNGIQSKPCLVGTSNGCVRRKKWSEADNIEALRDSVTCTDAFGRPRRARLILERLPRSKSFHLLFFICSF
jgi:hypothetical protein